MSKILVTGTAGFIGFHLVERLIRESIQTSKEEEKWDIVGLDNINDYYDVNLKYARLRESGITKKQIEYNKFAASEKYDKYRFIKINLEDKENILKLFEKENFDYVVNLAAQAGVRYSLTNPDSYVQSNIVGFLNILEACRYNKIKHLVYASSSSVYGLNTKMPLSTSDNVDHPISLYASTKKSNELMAHSYSYLYDIPTTGLRFFTVYGPWGRPDMAYFKFAKAILNDEAIEIYNNGNMLRDFTYIDDIVEGTFKLIIDVPKNKKYYRIFNIGNGAPINLLEFIKIIEKNLGKKTEKIMMPLQAGDMKRTWADIKKLTESTGYIPKTKINKGLRQFVDWFNSYYSSKGNSKKV